MTFQDRVNNGVMLLDLNVPGWRDKIDVDSLRLSSCSHCILGQILGSFKSGVFGIPVDHAWEYGFDIMPSEHGSLETWEKEGKAIELLWIKAVQTKVEEEVEVGV